MFSALGGKPAVVGFIIWIVFPQLVIETFGMIFDVKMS